MKSSKRTIAIVQIVGLVALLILVACSSPDSNSTGELPVYNPADVDPELVHHSVRSIDKDHRVADFNLINQNGEVVTQADYADKIYVTDFIFTRCPTMCLDMTNNMEKLQKKFIQDDDIKLLSISVTPVEDSVPILRRYADRYRVVDAKWNITTGDKRHIYDLARKSYFAATDDGDGGLQDFIHSPSFVLVDVEKQIRGIYDGTKKSEINRLIDDIETLKRNL
jgi:protein SCO1/2